MADINSMDDPRLLTMPWSERCMAFTRMGYNRGAHDLLDSIQEEAVTGIGILGGFDKRELDKLLAAVEAIRQSLPPNPSGGKFENAKETT